MCTLKYHFYHLNFILNFFYFYLIYVQAGSLAFLDKIIPTEGVTVEPAEGKVVVEGEVTVSDENSELQAKGMLVYTNNHRHMHMYVKIPQ
jgi:lipopolysaccharide export system protein LptA